MERSEKVGLGVAVAGHAVLFGLLSVGFLATPNPAKLTQQPVEVSLVKDVALEAAAPQSAPPAQSVAPDAGEPEDAAPPAESEPKQAPEPAPAPPPPAPQPKPQPPKPEPAPAAKPAPAPKPAPKPAPVRKTTPAPDKAAAKPTPAKPTSATAKPAPAKQVAAASPSRAAPAAAKGSGAKPESAAARPRGSRLGPNFLEGLTDKPSPAKVSAPSAAKLDARALASIVQAIARQIQPCADRQVTTGMPGANGIVTVLNLRLNQDGTLAATPRMVRQSGVDDENRRYAQRVADLGVAAFKGCSPLRLPSEYYHTPAGGWDNINYQWQLR